MLLKDFIQKSVSALEALYPEREARAMTFGLCSDVLGTQSYTHILEPQTEVAPDLLPTLEEMLGKLVSGMPLQYVTGRAEFFGFEFKVTQDVLIPRQETELLCRHAVDHVSRISRMRSASGKFAAPVRVLDICTGSGCIAWSIALSVPGVEVVGVDISEAALAVAASQDFSAQIKASKGRIKPPTFIRADVLDGETPFDFGSFDLICSNPPYVRESEKAYMNKNVLDYEPSLALFVPDEDPLVFYRAIASRSATCMAPGGIGLTEINEALAYPTAGLFAAEGFPHTEVLQDLNSKDRIVRYF